MHRSITIWYSLYHVVSFFNALAFLCYIITSGRRTLWRPGSGCRSTCGHTHVSLQLSYICYRMKLAPVLSVDDMRHWCLPRDGVVNAYVLTVCMQHENINWMCAEWGRRSYGYVLVLPLAVKHHWESKVWQAECGLLVLQRGDNDESGELNAWCLDSCP